MKPVMRLAVAETCVCRQQPIPARHHLCALLRLIGGLSVGRIQLSVLLAQSSEDLAGVDGMVDGPRTGGWTRSSMARQDRKRSRLGASIRAGLTDEM